MVGFPAEMMRQPGLGKYEQGEERREWHSGWKEPHELKQKQDTAGGVPLGGGQGD